MCIEGPEALEDENKVLDSMRIMTEKNGKPCCSVFDPNSEAAKSKLAEKAAKVEAVSDDMPF